MSASIPSIEPREITAGDTIKWTRDLSDYPAGTWTLTYYLTGPSKAEFVAAASGTTHSVTVAADTSVGWRAGWYELKGYVSDGSERYEVYSGRLKVNADPANLPAGTDSRSHARRCLEAIEAVLEGRASSDQLKYSIPAAGVELEKIPHTDLLKLRDYYRQEVEVEEEEAAAAAGEARSRNILVRFRSPR